MSNLYDRAASIITSAPCHLEADDQARIDWWTSEHPELSSAQSKGWYGYRTQQILLWRSDRISTVEPASLPDGLVP